MSSYNYKVVAELRKNLPEQERIAVSNEIRNLQKRLNIVNVNSITYCKAQPIKDCDDFGAVAFFYSALKDRKKYFSRLEYYDLRGDRKRVAI